MGEIKSTTHRTHLRVSRGPPRSKPSVKDCLAWCQAIWSMGTQSTARRSVSAGAGDSMGLLLRRDVSSDHFYSLSLSPCAVVATIYTSVYIQEGSQVRGSANGFPPGLRLREYAPSSLARWRNLDSCTSLPSPAAREPQRWS